MKKKCNYIDGKKNGEYLEWCYDGKLYKKYDYVNNKKKFKWFKKWWK
jgi:antitoxin component YwqK of YwqJK toxin-antitoxin module